MQGSAHPPSRSVADATGSAFTGRTRRKATELFSQGHAALEGMGPEIALVTVQDDREAAYRVAVDVAELENRDRLRVECQCSFFTAGHPCEHVFAALLAIEGSGDAARLIPARALERRIDVVPHRTGLPLGQDNFFDVEHAFSRADDKDGGSRTARTDWRDRLETLRRSAVPSPGPRAGALEGLELVLDLARSETAGAPVITARALDADRRRKVTVPLARRDLDRVPDPDLRAALEPWLACPPLGQRSGADALAPDPGLLAAETRRVPVGLQRAIFQALSGRVRFGPDHEILHLDDGPTWKLELSVDRDPQGVLAATGVLTRDGRPPRPLDDARLLLRDGWLVLGNKVAAFDPGPSFDWVRDLRREGPLVAVDGDPAELLHLLARLAALPPLRIGPELDGWTVQMLEPVPSIDLGGVDPKARRAPVRLSFLYGDLEVAQERPDAALVDEEHKRILTRDLGVERGWIRRLLSSGLESEDDDGLVARGGVLPEVEETLVDLGAQVAREGRRLLRGGESRLRLTSGTDWFDLDGEVNFEGTWIPLSAVLDSLRSRTDRVKLPDGSEGIVSAREARRLRALAGLGQRKHGHLRFASSQAILLDALISSAPQVDRDASFEQLIGGLRGDLAVDPSPQPPGFGGDLRPYQQIGLGWLEVLRRLGLGGCLADDMGLGKTVQVLALLLRIHRGQGADGQRPNRPSLVVAPRSLVFNWRQEAEKFAPELRLLEYTGQQRTAQLDEVGQADLLLTTYGTLRKDVDILAGLDFEYVILDEAQAIKNHAAQISKACRDLKGRHRLALSGTPVENDVSELWSIFEFLNPRMLGSRREFVRMAQGDALTLVGRGLSPLLLRRRKEDVLGELPEKTELTVYCDLGPEERRRYDELRVQYRSQIDAKVAKTGVQSVRTEVLEALLRLRQVACHQGLVDERRKSAPSTKVDTLLAHIEEVAAEGHKALVFSQFVKLLDIVRQRLDADGIKYTYLDGQVRDRESVVDRFQSDPEVSVFLISLRAGGLGLNLTAADYVFILDPWWNPAVEAQAIDRAHRIGQTRPVFAYRYIARDTVEEKILALHRDKRALAEALVGGDLDKGGKLSLDELRLLLQ